MIILSRDISQTVEKCPLSQCWRIFQNIPWSESGGRWVPEFHQFFLDHRYICDKIFEQICSVVLCKVANRQTDSDRQMRYVTSLANVLNQW